MNKKDITIMDDLFFIINLLENLNIKYWIDGGWGIDLLYGKQTRNHRDIDIDFDDYKNFASCGVDEENKVVIVELVDNSEKEQKWLKENINNSKYIQFEQGGPYTTYKVDFYITKPENHNGIKFNDYYDEKNGKVYMSGNIGELMNIKQDIL